MGSVQRLPQFRSRLLAPALSGSGPEPEPEILGSAPAPEPKVGARLSSAGGTRMESAARLEVADMASGSQELVDQWQVGSAYGTESLPSLMNLPFFGFNTQFKRYNGDRNGAFTAG
ncbi:unnamed protein product [Bursaphelenchus xylophilus]|uniref:(pine wood nematode) hypothetical protein n=1 Tax=Bursaphelenchus xylophilus TaxID=6326 RepID=A0A1I7SGC1_BURXY|nr:unnamed protein product [Bursaphelenchus xylophilus]CAG9132681.1 unnamed protein product [Bursaphelenchus xylophilus]